MSEGAGPKKGDSGASDPAASGGGIIVAKHESSSDIVAAFQTAKQKYGTDDLAKEVDEAREATGSRTFFSSLKGNKAILITMCILRWVYYFASCFRESRFLRKLTTTLGGDEAERKRREALKSELEMSEHKQDIEGLLSDLGCKAEVVREKNDKGIETFSVSEAAAFGLTDAQVKEKRKKFGKNRLTPPKKKPEILKLIEQMTGFFSLLLWLGAILCFIAYILKQEIDNLLLGSVLTFVVIVTGVFGWQQEYSSSKLMDSFKSLMADTTVVIRGGKISELNPTGLVPGDILSLTSGDKVPADVRMLWCSEDMKVDNAPLTGESELQSRSVLCTDENPLETKNLAFFGTKVGEGRCRCVVVNTGDNTVMGRIKDLTTATDDDDSPIKKEIHHFVLIVSSVAAFLGISFFIIGEFLGTDLLTNLVFMIGIIVANVPEGLLLTVTICLALTAARMANNSVVVKKMEGVETLGSTTCICSDKTGTLTQNIMTVANLVFDLNLYSAGAGTQKDNINYKSPTFSKLQRCMALCNAVVWSEKSKYGLKKTDGSSGSSAASGFFSCFKKKSGEEDDEDAGYEIDYSDPQAFKQTKTLGDGQLAEFIKWVPLGNATEGAMSKFVEPRLKEKLGAEGLVDEDDVTASGLDAYREKVHKVVAQIPFNSTNKYQVDIYRESKEGGQLLVMMKGAPERILTRCSHYYQDGELVEFDEEAVAAHQALLDHCSRQGLRVLGFAEKPLSDEDYPRVDKEDGTPGEFKFQTQPPNFPVGAPRPDAAKDPVAAAEHLEVSEEKLHFLGLVAVIDPPRPQVPSAVESCKTAGIRVIMVTGDHPTTAEAIAKQVGIIWGDNTRKEPGEEFGPATEQDYDEYNRKWGLSPETPEVLGADGRLRKYFDPRLAPAVVVPGWEFKDGERPKEWWDDVLDHNQVVFARTSPQQKLVIVEACQRRKEVVAVTGDGVNDAPALKKADIGVAMGIMGTGVSKEAADMILLDDNFASIVKGVQQGRLIFDNLKKSIAYTLSSNIPEISPFLCFITVQTPLPLSTVLILAVDLGTDMVPAISMAWEEPESDIMRRPPRNAAVDRLVTAKLVCFAYLQIGVIQALAGFYTWMVVLNDYGYPPHILPGLGTLDNWGKQSLYCKFDGTPTWVDADGVEGVYYGEITSTGKPAYFFRDWGTGTADDATVKDCKFAARNIRGSGSAPDGYNYYDPATAALSNDQLYAPNYIASRDSIQALIRDGYYEYMPFKGRRSPYWVNEWLRWRATDSGSLLETAGLVPGLGGADSIVQFAHQPIGMFQMRWYTDNTYTTECNRYPFADATAFDPTCATPQYGSGSTWSDDYNDGPMERYGLDNSKTTKYAKPYTVTSIVHNGVTVTGTFAGENKPDQSGTYTLDARLPYIERITSDETGTVTTSDIRINVASRMMQKEALHHAQSAYFVCIVIVQWADLVICKTRMNSIYEQGMTNPAMNFGLIFETILACLLCYTPLISYALGTRPLRFTHWAPAVPFSIFIFLYDEIRKWIMRHTTVTVEDPDTKQIFRDAGWLERNTYY